MIFKLARAWMKARSGEGSTYAGLAVVGVWLEAQTSIDFEPLLDVVPEIIAGVTSGNWPLSIAVVLLAVGAIIKNEAKERRTIEGRARDVNQDWTGEGVLNEPSPVPPNPQGAHSRPDQSPSAPV